MRLLVVIHNPVYGGAHVQAIRLRRPLEELGVETLVVTTDEPANGLERMRAAGLDVIAMPLHRLRATPDPRAQLGFLGGFAPEVGAVRRLIRERRVDVVQVHGPTHPHGAIAAHREGVALVWQIYDTVAPMWLRRVTMPLVVRLADVITTWGRALAEEHPGAGSLGERCVAVFPPVDGERFSYDDNRRATARAELGIPEGTLAIGTVGNRNPAKGHDLLIAAAAELRTRRDDVTFRILGAPSPAHARWERKLHERIRELGLQRMVGFVDPGDRVANLVGGLDVFTMSSPPRSEGMPTAILEAMAAGLPVVSTDVGAVREEVEDGTTGVLVEPGRPDRLAAGWDRLCRHPDERARMGAEGQRRVRERFDLRSLARLTLSAYERAIAHRAARAS